MPGATPVSNHARPRAGLQSRSGLRPIGGGVGLVGLVGCLVKAIVRSHLVNYASDQVLAGNQDDGVDVGNRSWRLTYRLSP
jgi:hypothetical protein